MTTPPPSGISRVDPASFSWDSPSGVAAGVRRVVAEASAADSRSSLNESTLLSLRNAGLSSSSLWTAGDDDRVVGFALAAPDEGPVEGPDVCRDEGHCVGRDQGSVEGRPQVVVADLVVEPSSRGRGIGRALADAAMAAFPRARFSAWSHGNHPAAAALAPALGFDRVRDLWVMRRSMGDQLPPVNVPATTVVRTFDPERDTEAFLDLNAEAFAHHPEQGEMTRADLDQRMAEPWFDPAGFFLAERAPSPSGAGSQGRPDLLGFHWTKVHGGDPAHGEVYVVGVSPAAQGLGLGKVLTLVGLHHLRGLDLPEVILYVESDNAPAVAVYARLGFGHADADTDVMYSRIP